MNGLTQLFLAIYLEAGYQFALKDFSKINRMEFLSLFLPRNSDS